MTGIIQPRAHRVEGKCPCCDMRRASSLPEIVRQLLLLSGQILPEQVCVPHGDRLLGRLPLAVCAYLLPRIVATREVAAAVSPVDPAFVHGLRVTWGGPAGRGYRRGLVLTMALSVA